MSFHHHHHSETTGDARARSGPPPYLRLMDAEAAVSPFAQKMFRTNVCYERDDGSSDMRRCCLCRRRFRVRRRPWIHL